MGKMTEKDYKVYNKSLYAKIVASLNALKSQCNNAVLLSKIEGARQELDSCVKPNSQECLNRLGIIEKMVSDVSGAMSTGNLSKASEFIEDIIATSKQIGALPNNNIATMHKKQIKEMKVAEKAKAKYEKIAKKMGTNNQSVKRIDELNQQLSDKSNELDKILSRMNILAPRLQSGMASLETQMEWKSKTIQLNALNKELEFLKAEIEREVSTTSIADVAKYGQILIIDRKITDDQIANSVNQLNILNEELNKTNAINKTVAEALQTNNTSQVSMDAFNTATSSQIFNTNSSGMANVNIGQYDNLVGLNTQGANAFGGQTNTFTSNPYTTQQNPFGAANTSAARKKELQKVINQMDKMVEDWNEKMDEYNEVLEDLDRETRSLLMKRETASPSECLALDGKIDQANAKRSTIKNSITRYRNIQNKIIEEKGLLERVMLTDEIEAVNNMINNAFGGQLKDLDSLANYVAESIQKNNEELLNAGGAVMVADGVQVDTNTLSSMNGELSSMEKDEDKYEELKREVGLLK